ncbi:hypothetical protein PROFUN_15122 [Planoprotostelium fungivorum]|uniref:MORN repeat-containing protein n=1 Tax=Planoprotostelium fungivorum TaxID=1890364 RepID=A0A2P6MZU6_9EUKA|nr:hypothetical protein PROFUN_15122 [Planoprotostelium fungivorum]
MQAHPNRDYDMDRVNMPTLVDYTGMRESGRKGRSTAELCILMSEGNFVQGEIEGYGVKTWPSGKKYEGEFLGGEFHGRGLLTYSNSTQMCQGTWRNNKLHGDGRRLYSDGSVYEGQFNDHKPHGLGSFEYSNGSNYTGSFIDGKRQGRGKMIENASLWIYDGSWSEDQRQGLGKYEEQNGIHYQGSWVDDQPSKPQEMFPTITVELHNSLSQMVSEESGRRLGVSVTPSISHIGSRSTRMSANRKTRERSPLPQSSSKISHSAVGLPNEWTDASVVLPSPQTLSMEVSVDCGRALILGPPCRAPSEEGEYRIFISDESDSPTFRKLPTITIPLHITSNKRGIHSRGQNSGP